MPTEEERLSENETRTRIVEIMFLLRKKLHGNKFLLQHNIEYGAMRNVIGGSVLGAIFSITNIIFFSYLRPTEMAIYVSVFTLSVYTVILLSSKVFIDFYENNYAKILYREYLGE